MTFKKFFATQTMVLGLGAALLFAGSARAQAPSTAAYDQQAQVTTTAPATQDVTTEEALVPLNAWAVVMLLAGMGICVYFVPKTVAADRNSNFNMAEAKDRRWVASQAGSVNTVASLQ